MNVSYHSPNSGPLAPCWLGPRMSLPDARACIVTVRKLECGKATPQRGTLSRIVAALEAGGVEFSGGGVQPKNSKMEF